MIHAKCDKMEASEVREQLRSVAMRVWAIELQVRRRRVLIYIHACCSKARIGVVVIVVVRLLGHWSMRWYSVAR